MANPYYNFTAQLVPGTKVRSDQLNNELEGITAGFDYLPSDPESITRGVATLGIDTQGATANEYDITMNNTRTSVQTGDEVVFLATHTNTGSGVVINVDGLGDVQVRGSDLSVLQAGDIVSGRYYVFRHTGAVFQMIGNTPSYLAATLAAAAAASANAAAAAASEAAVAADAETAEDSATAAATSETNASNSASAASSSASAAAASAATAGSAASSATTSATNASNSAVAASASESAAGTSETNAATSEANAAASESAAATSETNASNSETNAAASAATALGTLAEGETYAEAAEAWAITAEDEPVAVEYGGDGSTTFSARHWAAKSAELSVAGVVSGSGVEPLNNATVDYDAKLLVQNANDVTTARLGWEDGYLKLVNKKRANAIRIDVTAANPGLAQNTSAEFANSGVTLFYPQYGAGYHGLCVSNGISRFHSSLNNDVYIALAQAGDDAATDIAIFGFEDSEDDLVISNRKASSTLTLSVTPASGITYDALKIDPDNYWSLHHGEGGPSLERDEDSINVYGPIDSAGIKISDVDSPTSRLAEFKLSDDILYISNYKSGGSVAIRAQGAVSGFRDVFSADPDAGFILGHQGADHTSSSINALNVTPNDTAEVKLRLLDSSNSTVQAWFGYDGDANLTINNANTSSDINFVADGANTLTVTPESVLARTGAANVANSSSLRRVATIDDLTYTAVVASDVTVPHDPGTPVSLLSCDHPAFNVAKFEMFLKFAPIGEGGFSFSISATRDSMSTTTTISNVLVEWFTGGESGTSGSFLTDSSSVEISQENIGNLGAASITHVRITGLMETTGDPDITGTVDVDIGYDSPLVVNPSGEETVCLENSFFKLTPITYS